jgi:hypothetical protein
MFALKRSKFAPESAIVLAAALTFFLFTGSIQATLLGTVPTAPGSTVIPGLVPPGTFPGLLASDLSAPFSYTTNAGTTSGTLHSAVFRGDDRTFDFYYQVSNSAASATSIARESDTNFAGTFTALGFRVDGSTLPFALFVNGTQAPFSGDVNTTGAVVGFSFSPGASEILPGQTSNVLVISTNAGAFTTGNAEVIDVDGGAQIVPAFHL